MNKFAAYDDTELATLRGADTSPELFDLSLLFGSQPDDTPQESSTAANNNNGGGQRRHLLQTTTLPASVGWVASGNLAPIQDQGALVVGTGSRLAL